MQEHKNSPEKDYWTAAIIFTTSNNSFGPTEISYLENRFCNLAMQANCYIIKNGNDPTPGDITEEKEKILQEDVLLHSPSYAASFIIGGHVNGLTEWKTSEGETLREIEEESDQ